MKKILSGVFFAFLSTVFIIAQDNRLKSEKVWQQSFSMSSIPISSNITGSNLVGQVAVKSDSAGGIYLLCSNTHLYRPYSVYMLHINSNGYITDSARVAGATDLVPQMPLYFDNTFFLNCALWNGSDYTDSTILLNSHFYPAERKVPLYFCNAVETNNGFLSFISFYDSIGNVFGQKKIRSDSIAYLVKTKDFENFETIVQVPVSSQIIDEYNFKYVNDEVIGFLNNTILRGPDHHDIYIYRFDKDLHLNLNRTLTGKSSLGWLMANDIEMDSEGNILLAGTSNDVVDFKSPGVFNNISEKDNFYTYTFLAVYSKKGSLKNLLIFDKNYETMYDRQFYKILFFNSDKIVAYNRNKPEMLDINLRNNEIKRIPLDVNPIKNSEYESELFYFISTNEFFRVKIQNGFLNTNFPPLYTVEKFRLSKELR
jgi:hypothetical protein